MANIMICLDYSSMVVYHPNQAIFFWEIMLIGVDKASKLFAFSLPSKLNILIKSVSLEVITNLPQSLGSMVSSKNVLMVIIVGKNRYSTKLWKSFIDCFNCMPVSAII